MTVLPPEWRLLGFGIAVTGAVLTLAATLAGGGPLAGVGLRVVGVGLATMGLVTIRRPESLVGADPRVGRVGELVRGVVLLVVGVLLAVAPGVVVALVGR